MNSVIEKYYNMFNNEFQENKLSKNMFQTAAIAFLRENNEGPEVFDKNKETLDEFFNFLNSIEKTDYSPVKNLLSQVNIT